MPNYIVLEYGMPESERRPFIFGVGYILDEFQLDDMLHRQFNSDEELAEYMRTQGYKVDFKDPKNVVDIGTGVVVQRVRIDKNGGVGSLELIDEKDKSKLQALIDEAADIQRRRKLNDPEVRGLFG